MWALILAASLGPGSEMTHDCGYWTRPEGQAGRKWVALPKRLVLVGIEDKEEAKSLGRKPMYVFGERGHGLRGSSHILSLNDVLQSKVHELKSGPLPIVEWSEIEVPIRR